MDDLFVNYHEDAEDPGDAWTPLKRYLINNPTTEVVVETTLGRRPIAVPYHRVLEFIKHDPLIVGVIDEDHPQHNGYPRMSLEPLIDWEHALDE